MAAKKREIKELTIEELKGDSWLIFILFIICFGFTTWFYFYSPRFGFAIIFALLTLAFVVFFVWYQIRLRRAKRAEKALMRLLERIKLPNDGD